MEIWLHEVYFFSPLECLMVKMIWPLFLKKQPLTMCIIHQFTLTDPFNLNKVWDLPKSHDFRSTSQPMSTCCLFCFVKKRYFSYQSLYINVKTFNTLEVYSFEQQNLIQCFMRREKWLRKAEPWCIWSSQTYWHGWAFYTWQITTCILIRLTEPDVGSL